MENKNLEAIGVEAPNEPSKRDKRFVFCAVVVSVFLLVVCPLAFVLDSLNIRAVEDMANYMDPERLYFFNHETRRVEYRPFWEGVAIVMDGFDVDGDGEDLFIMPSFRDLRQDNVPLHSRIYIDIMNGLQRLRAEVNNVYTNFLPFYAQILGFENFNNRIDTEMVFFMHNPRYAVSSWLIGWANAINPVEPQPVVYVPAYTYENGEENGEEPLVPIRPSPQHPPMSSLWPDHWVSVANEQVPNNVSELTFLTNRLSDRGLFRFNRAMATDRSFGFIEIMKAMTYGEARRNMQDELYNINRIAAASVDLDVNFFVYFATTGQSTPWFDEMFPHEFSTYELKREMFEGFENLAGLAYLDIGTLERRLQFKWLTDHHMNAYGVAQSYLEVHHMMYQVIPDFGPPVALLDIRYFDHIEFRGSGANRSGNHEFFDRFSVPVWDLPTFHPSRRVTNILAEFERGQRTSNLNTNTLANHYEHLHGRPTHVTVTSNDTGRNLLILGDSMVYWSIEPIASHFDNTFIHYTLQGNRLDLTTFVNNNNITDILLFQYGPRTLAKATSATVYLEQIITR